MKVENTVLDEAKLKEMGIDIKGSEYKYITLRLLPYVLEVQAGISFKLGYEEGVDAEGWCDGFNKGIKEVVDWVNRYGWWSTDCIFGEYRVEEWEEQLKEWGINP